MTNARLSTMMASAVVLGSLMTGCSTAGADRPQLALDNPAGFAPQIEKMLAEENAAGALAAAEQLVAAQPDNGDARALLGRAYLANGRYLSARTAFNDALALGNRAPRTIVSLSMSEAGLGNLDAARALLAAHGADLPAADYGLAMTMAGDPREGVRALLAASRAPDATAKTRQNLAYALAMAGAWAQARLIAGQDLVARDAEARVGEWAQSLTQSSPSERVVAMLGVSPRVDDGGVPVQLARQAQPAPDAVASADAEAVQDVAVAAAEPAPAARPAFSQEALIAALSAPVSVPRVVPAAEDAALASAETPATAPAAQPAVHAGAQAARDVQAVAFTPDTTPVAQAAPTRASLEQAFGKTPAKAASAVASVSFAAPASDASASDWVVQLGAYDSEAVAREKWKRIAARAAPLKAYPTVHSQFATDGRTFHRLAIRGFADRGAAAAACATLKSAGQPCFVRLDDTNATRLARREAAGSGVQAAASGAGRARASR